MIHASDETQFNYRVQLLAELNRRKLMNPRYSLRAFARAIGFSPAFLSKLLRGEKNLSPGRALIVAEKLGYTGDDRRQFVRLVQISNSDSAELREILSSPSEDDAEASEFTPVGLDRFQVISDWYHYAILELSQCTGFKAKPSYIARRLGITTEQAQQALIRLQRVGLLKAERGTLVKSDALIATPSGIPSQAIRNFHSQMIHKAQEALTQQSIERRDISGITLSIKKEHLELARKEIKAFRRKMSKLLEVSKGDSVYQLNIQFFSLEAENEL